MTNITIKELVDKINASTKVTAGTGTPNPETRDGIYLGIRTGLSSASYFVRLDKESGKFIIEPVA